MRSHMLAQLVCLGRHTLTGVQATAGRVGSDWSADCRLYSRERFDPEEVFAVARRRIDSCLEPKKPMVVAMDDSVMRKTGTKIYGVGYRRDPLSPPFHVNFMRGQRILQLSAALPLSQAPEIRMVPVAFQHVPVPAKPSRKADALQWSEYRKAVRENRIGRLGLQSITRLRQSLDDDGREKRPLHVVVDGRFTNRTVMRQLPERTVFIGRIRADAKLYHLPEAGSKQITGRRRIYGPDAPTPEQLRQSEDVPWQTIQARACGRTHQFRLKVLRPLRWRATSDQVDVQIVVIAPLGYRLTKQGRVLYRKPAYLVCTDPNLSLQQLLQAYLWRWDIEVNFRDEKTLLGLGQAQVRTPASTELVPALTVAAYSLLLLAANRPQFSPSLPPPLWRRSPRKRRASLPDLIAQLRHDLWADSIRSPRFSHFTLPLSANTKSEKPLPSLRGALFYAPA